MQIFFKTGEAIGWVGRGRGVCLSQFKGKSDCGKDQGVVRATEQQEQEQQQTRRRCPTAAQSSTQGLAYIVLENHFL